MRSCKVKGQRSVRCRCSVCAEHTPRERPQTQRQVRAFVHQLSGHVHAYISVNYDLRTATVFTQTHTHARSFTLNRWGPCLGSLGDNWVSTRHNFALVKAAVQPEPAATCHGGVGVVLDQQPSNNPKKFAFLVNPPLRCLHSLGFCAPPILSLSFPIYPEPISPPI